MDARCRKCAHEERDCHEYPCSGCVVISLGDIDYHAPKPEKPEPEGIDIVMVCGEKYHIDTVQPEIETVTLNGEQVYPQEDTPKATHIDKPRRAGGTRKGSYDLIACDDYYLESDDDGDHIEVKDKNGDSVATLCAHAFTPKTRIYS